MGALVLPDKYSDPDPVLIPILIDLRERVDHFGVDFEKIGKIQTVTYDGVIIGYRLIEVRDGVFLKRVLVKFPQPIDNIPEGHKDPIVLACFSVFVQEGMGPVDLTVAGDHGESLIIDQEFMPLILTKRETAKTHIKIDDDIDKALMKAMKPWEN